MRSGFTLIELLIALTIFAVLSALAFTGLSRSTAITGRLKEEALFSRSLAAAWARISVDVAQCRDAPSEATGEPATDALAIWAAPDGFPSPRGRSERLVRVEYRRVEGALVRLAWFSLPGRSPRLARSRLLEGVRDVKVSTLFEQGDRRPRAVAVTLALDGRGSWTRHFACAR